MRIKDKSCLIGLVFLLAFSLPASATSLFHSPGASMFADQKARQEGDLVTLIIVEQAQARQSADTSSGKEASTSFGPGVGVLADLIPLLRVGGNDDFSASGSTSRGGSLTAKVTTRVIEVFPNGSMKIEGTQTISINGEDQKIIVSGIVRSRDIQPDNTVLSPLVADAQIEFSGAGVIGDKQDPGILTRLLNWLF